MHTIMTFLLNNPQYLVGALIGFTLYIISEIKSSRKAKQASIEEEVHQEWVRYEESLATGEEFKRTI